MYAKSSADTAEAEPSESGSIAQPSNVLSKELMEGIEIYL
jgi:hypothetical protein